MDSNAIIIRFQLQTKYVGGRRRRCAIDNNMININFVTHLSRHEICLEMER